VNGKHIFRSHRERLESTMRPVFMSSSFLDNICQILACESGHSHLFTDSLIVGVD
jgi:hypothetical protein